jgi:Ser-tRNA(Ala) deacylase AlaX
MGFYSSKQPCDHGLLDDVAVLQVTRRGAEAVHFVESALPVGKLVKQKLNWERRFDHMQQHSGMAQVFIHLL